MPGKKWCEYCRINLPFDKKAIQDHESTRLHIQNKQRHITYERIKIMKEQKAAKQSAKANQLLSTANIPKAAKGSALERQVNEYRDNVITNGKMAIHQLIAQKTKGLYGAPIEYPNKQDLVLAENYMQEQPSNENDDNESQNFQMWKIDICEETGKPCFINKVTKMKLFEPPKGYVLSEEQKEEWEEVQKICEDMPEENLDEVGEVGQWQEVASQQDFFEKNKAQSSENEEQQRIIDRENKVQYKLKKEGEIKEENVKKQVQRKSWMENLRDKIENNEINEREVFEHMVNNTLNECRNMKQKNDTLKKLIRNDIQIHRNLDNALEKELQEGEKKTKVGFNMKPRKKVKTAQLISQKDIV